MNVLIFGHYGGDNFGDEIMLDSIIGFLRKKNIEKIYFVTKTPSIYSTPDCVEPISYNVRSTIKALYNCKVVVLAGGTHFHDDYNNQRLKRHFIYLFKIIALSTLSRVSMKRVYYAGVGYGPIESWLTKILTKISSFFTNRIIVRDRSSYQTILRLCNNDKVVLSKDLVFLSEKFKCTLERPKETLGISLTSFQYSSNTITDNFWTDSFFTELESTFKRDPHLVIKIFIFRGGNRETDRHLSYMLYDILIQFDKTRVELVEFTYHIDEFIKQIHQCNYFIATRYHSAVLAYLSGCRVSIIPYHEKLYSLKDDLKLNSPILKNFDAISSQKFIKATLELNRPDCLSIKKTQKSVLSDYSNAFHIL